MLTHSQPLSPHFLQTPELQSMTWSCSKSSPSLLLPPPPPPPRHYVSTPPQLWYTLLFAPYPWNLPRKKAQEKRQASQIPNIPIMPHIYHPSSCTLLDRNHKTQCTWIHQPEGPPIHRFVYGTIHKHWHLMNCLVGVKQNPPSTQKWENEKGFSSCLLWFFIAIIASTPLALGVWLGSCH